MTKWQRSRYDRILAEETPEWREKRRVAEDPDATSDVLVRIADEALERTNAKYQPNPQSWRTCDALAAHPNLPLVWLVNVVNEISFFSIEGFSRNPLLPLLCLEMPDFWDKLWDETCGTLLAYDTLPLPIVQGLARHSNPAVAQITSLHILMEGEIKTSQEGNAALNDFWRTYCRNPPTPKGQWVRFPAFEWHAECVRLGLAPSWAAPEPCSNRRLTNAVLWNEIRGWSHLKILRRMTRPSPAQYIEQAFLIEAGRAGFEQVNEFIEFVAAKNGTFWGWHFLDSKGGGTWFHRLNAALCVPVSDAPLLYDRAASQRDLLEQLARDGNRLVRWAAQTRLDDPDFVFTWDNE